jgi:hypothetical protein
MGVLVVFSWRPETPERHKKSSKICIINFSGYAFPKTMILQGIRRPMSGDLKVKRGLERGKTKKRGLLPPFLLLVLTFLFFFEDAEGFARGIWAKFFVRNRSISFPLFYNDFPGC